MLVVYYFSSYGLKNPPRKHFAHLLKRFLCHTFPEINIDGCKGSGGIAQLMLYENHRNIFIEVICLNSNQTMFSKHKLMLPRSLILFQYSVCNAGFFVFFEAAHLVHCKEGLSTPSNISKQQNIPLAHLHLMQNKSHQISKKATFQGHSRPPYEPWLWLRNIVFFINGM